MIRASNLAAACLVLLPGCGARGELDVPSESITGVHAPPPPPPPCTAWQPAGTLVTISEPGPDSANSYLMSMIPSAGGALLAWLTLGDDPMSSWRTVALDLDATPRADIETHLSFPTGDGGNPMSLASNGSSIAALVADNDLGCRFLPLDENGVEIGPAQQVWFSLACAHLAPTPHGFSYIASDIHESAPFRLVNLDMKGSFLSVTQLVTPSEWFADGWLTLPDQSFLLASTDLDGAATSSQRFSPDGAPLTDRVEITTAGPYEMPLVETSKGVLATWGYVTDDPGSIYTRLLDEGGSPLAAATRIGEGVNDIVDTAALAATPGGDALLVWIDRGDATNVYALALGPDGAPRGASTPLGSFSYVGAMQAVVAADGRRALLAFSAAQGMMGERVFALPLACSP